MQVDTLIVNGILVTVNPDFEIIEKWLVKSRKLVSLNLDEILDHAIKQGERIQHWRTHRETT